VGRLDLSNRLAVRSGERPSLMSNNSLSNSGSGMAPQSTGMKGLPCAPAGLMNGPRHDLFSGTGFAYDEHAEIRIRDPFNGGNHAADGPRWGRTSRAARGPGGRDPPGVLTGASIGAR